jgi:arylsulfatase A
MTIDSPILGATKYPRNLWREALVSLVLLMGPTTAATSPVLTAREPDQKNVLLILADDLGWSDLSSYGSNFHETPHIDGLASQGVRFSNAYAMPVCSPSRAALLTGKHPARLRMTIWSEGSRRGPSDRRLLQAESLHDLPHSETTLAEIYRRSGYVTALVGKWHLGDATHYPETQGFDVNIGGTQWGAPQSFFWPYRGRGRFGPEFRYVPDLEFGSPGEYLTDRLTQEAIEVIDQAGDQPWFLYLAHHAPHTPIEAKEPDVRYFEKKLEPTSSHRNPVYAAMLRSLDESVGRILAHLQQRQLAEDTIVIFASDNGGYIGRDRNQDIPATTNAPLRSGKGSLYEGGIRIPLIIHWPGVTPADRVSDQPVVLMDLFHTLAAPVSGDSTGGSQDGVDLRPLLSRPETELDERDLFFHYPHYYHAPRTSPVSAIRSGDWKLLEHLEDGKVELYNLREDPSEESDVSSRFPEVAQSLLTDLADWRRQVDAAMPKPNPDFREETAHAPSPGR